MTILSIVASSLEVEMYGQCIGRGQTVCYCRVLNCPLFRVSIIAGSTVYVCSLALCQRVCTRTDNMA